MMVNVDLEATVMTLKAVMLKAVSMVASVLVAHVTVILNAVNQFIIQSVDRMVSHTLINAYYFKTNVSVNAELKSYIIMSVQQWNVAIIQKIIAQFIQRHAWKGTVFARHVMMNATMLTQFVLVMDRNMIVDVNFARLLAEII